ncbi:MAG TPA: hypothetical protein VK563_13485 [Puia sp.]|nr:hypothetical protein [Puia sp.]
MALNVKINFEDLYETITMDADLRSSVFDAVLKGGTTTRLGIQISSKIHPLMPNVYNLAFGPIDINNEIDDQAKLTHQNHSKVFSTIIFAGLSFLTEHKENYLGIDGSNNARAYLYYRCIQNNFEYLRSFFKIYGVNHYVRILRRAIDDSYSFDPEDLVAIPKLIEFRESIQHEKLYNHFIFKIKEE